jgi:LysM repeat protein
MTDRGLPLVDGAPACPFVAFEDDRDARATAPDHRHRCYAEVRPAPRALAHQEAYCLSSAFPVCPTFQDWARREAAQARAAATAEGDDAGDAGDAASPPAPPDSGLVDATTVAPGSQRNPPRNWAAPPPWLSSRDGGPEDEEPDVEIRPPVRGGGLAGSFADRLVGGSDRDTQPRNVAAHDEGWAEDPARPSSPRPARPRREGRSEQQSAPLAVPGPSWERPRRLEAYPTLKTRIGLPSLSLPPMLVGVAALVLAAVALFFLPTILGLFDDQDGTGGGPSPSAAASGAPASSPAEPTPTPAPTPQVYVVRENDTFSAIATRYGLTIQALKDANPQIENIDRINVGDEIIIPVAAPTTLPGVSPSPSPTA